jgi:hypothetical protein
MERDAVKRPEVLDASAPYRVTLYRATPYRVTNHRVTLH